MEIPQGAKFIFIAFPLLLVACILIFIYLGKDRSTNASTDSSDGKEVEVSMDFDQLEIETTKEGEGPEAVDGNTLVVHYEGTLKNEVKFDSSYERGVPFEFILGAGQVIRGWDEGLKGMKVGEERTLKIPSSMAYGSNGGSLIPANSGLIFRVSLLDIK